MTHSEAIEMDKADGSSTYEVVDRPGGSVAFEVTGSGPLIVCVPGMGDLRSSYRFLQSQLIAAGYRVALMDLRGHGDSDTTFAEYGDAATASDMAALIEQLGGPAVIVGNSMAAGAAVVLAAEHPELVIGLVLVGPFVREHGASALTRLFLRVLMAPFWAASTWHAYLPKLYAGMKPADFNAYRATLKAALRRPGYAKAFSLTTRISHDVAEAALSSVTAPTLVIMGELDPDFPAPAAEAAWIADRTRGTILMVPEAGHYPQSQRPDLVGPAIAAFTDRITSA
jgi:pimeloyl-ACP methyl ester carboxylesterase